MRPGKVFRPTLGCEEEEQGGEFHCVEGQRARLHFFSWHGVVNSEIYIACNIHICTMHNCKCSYVSNSWHWQICASMHYHWWYIRSTEMNTRSSPNRPEKKCMKLISILANFQKHSSSQMILSLTWEEMKERKRRWPTQSLLLGWQDFFEPAFQISSIFPKIHLFTVAHTVVTLNLFPAGPTGPSTVTFITVSFF